MTPLSTRETQVIEWLSKGKTHHEIGQLLGTSSRTVTCQVQNIKLKLRADNVVHAITIAIKERLIISK